MIMTYIYIYMCMCITALDIEHLVITDLEAVHHFDSVNQLVKCT